MFEPRRQLQASVGLAQLRLQPLAFGDIKDYSDGISGLARRVPLECGEQLHPDERAVFAEVAFLQGEAGQFAAH